MDELPLKPPLFYKYPPPDRNIILNINNSILKNPEFYIRICHLMNIMDLTIPFKSCPKKLRFLSQTYSHHKFIKNSETIEINQCIFPKNDKEISDISEEENENERILKEEFSFLLNTSMIKLFDEIMNDFSLKKINIEILFKKLNLLKLLLSKDYISRNQLYNKLSIINKINQLGDKASDNKNKRPRVLLESELKDLQNYEKVQKKTKFHQAKQPNPNNIIENSLPIVFDYKLLDKENKEYSEEIKNFLAFEQKKVHSNEINEILEIENDFYFSSSISQPQTIKKKEKNEITKQFIDINRCSAKELEIINKGPYFPGPKTNILYLKNVHSKLEKEEFENILKVVLGIEYKAEEIQIDLIKKGRMHNQGFIKCRYEKIAEKILESLNGFYFYEKPIIIMYSKSKTETENKI